MLLVFIAWKQYALNPLAATRPETKILIMANDTEMKKRQWKLQIFQQMMGDKV